MSDPKMALAPCPFCGAPPSVRRQEVPANREQPVYFFVACGKCEPAWGGSLEDAAKIWNRRASPKEEMEFREAAEALAYVCNRGVEDQDAGRAPTITPYGSGDVLHALLLAYRRLVSSRTERE
jgi:hypothetical protein